MRSPATTGEEWPGGRGVFQRTFALGPISEGSGASVPARPEQLGPSEQEVLSQRKGSRADAAELFTLTTSRQPETRRVIDEDNSTFCGGAYVDGLWVQTNPGCKNNVKFKTITAPSDYVTVNVDPAPPSRAVAFASVE